MVVSVNSAGIEFYNFHSSILQHTKAGELLAEQKNLCYIIDQAMRLRGELRCTRTVNEREQQHENAETDRNAGVGAISPTYRRNNRA